MADSGSGPKEYGLSERQLAVVDEIAQTMGKLPNNLANRHSEPSSRHMILAAKLGQLQPGSPNTAKISSESTYLG